MNEMSQASTPLVNFDPVETSRTPLSFSLSEGLRARLNIAMSVAIYTAVLIAFMLIGLVPNAKADSSVRFDSLSNAAKCAYAAKIAVRLQFASMEDLRLCTRAIRTENLSEEDLAKTFMNRGVLRKKLNERTAALRDYYMSRNLHRDEPGLYVNIGNIFYGSNDYGKAIAYYDRALAMGEPSVAVQNAAFINRGLANERLGDTDAAIHDYQRALELKPDHPLSSDRLDALERGETAAAGFALEETIAGL